MRCLNRNSIFACLSILALWGCDPNAGTGGGGGGQGGGISQLFGGKSSNTGAETWTIECSSFEGNRREETADRLATLLKQNDRLAAGRVWVQHEDPASRIFYGDYQLHYRQAQTDGKDKSKGDLVIELSDEIKRDLRYIRELALGDQYPFFSARPIPKPQPFAGKPEWDLRNASGLYTLNVGVTFPTPELHDYRQAAYEWVADLRKRGHQAYYYFDPQRSTASICVGTFGDEAFVLDAQGRKGYSAAVKSLQAKEEFKYNLENGHLVYNWVSNPETNQRERIPNYSFLAQIPQREDVKPGS